MTSAETERLLKAIIDAEPECVKLLARDHSILEMNRAGLRMIEADDRSDVIGRSVLPLVAPEHRAAFQEVHRRAFEGHPGSLEFDLVGLKGTRRTMETHVVPVRDREEAIVAVLAITRDVTHLKQAHAALRRGEALFRALVEHSSDAIVLLSADGAIPYASPSTQRVLGLAPAALVGRSVVDLVHPEDQPALLALISTRRDAGDAGRTEARMRSGRGGWIWTEIVAQDLLEEPDVNAIVLHVRDITARCEAEHALRESEARFRTLTEQAPDIIFRYQLAPAPGFQYVSPSAAAITGYTPEEHYADPELGLKITHPDDRAVLERILRSRQVPSAPLTLRWTRKDGGVVWTEQQLVPVRDAAGQVVAVEGVARDVTRRQEAEAALARSLSLLRATLESTTDGILVVDEAGRIVDGNRRCAELWQIAPEALVPGADAAAVLAPTPLKDPDAFRRTIALLQADPEATSHDVIEFADGRVLECHSQPPRVGGVPVGRIWSFRDITERRRTEQQILRQLQGLTTLYASAQKLSQSLQVQELAEFIASTARRMFGAALAWVGRAEADGTVRILSASPDDSYTRELRLRWNLPPAEETPSARALRTGFPVIVTRPAEELPAGQAARFAARGFKAGGAFPLISRSRPFGVLALYSDAPDFFADGRMDMYQAFAHQAAAALENARLFEESQRRASEFEALYETAQILSMQQDLRGVLQTVIDRAGALLGVGGGAIHFFDPVREELEVVVVRGFPLTVGARRPVTVGVAGAAARQREPIVVDDYARWEGRNRELDTCGIRSAIGVPMVYRGELIGVLTVGERGERTLPFTPDDVRLLTLFAAQAASAVHNARLFEEARRRMDQLQALHDIDTAITSSMDVRVTLTVFLDKVTGTLGVDAADVLLLNEASQTLEYIAGRGFRTSALQHSRLPLSRGYAGQAAAQRRTIVVPDLAAAPGEFHRSPLLREEGFVSYVACPLIAKGQVRGVLELFHRSPLAPAPEWQAFLATLTGQAAIAIDNATLVSDLQKANVDLTLAYDTTLEGWSRALDLRDRETEGHTQRVTELTLRLARAMGVREEELIHIRRGALLHDIGKMGIPDSILLKPGPLTEEEWAIMRRHPVFAFQLLHPIPHLRQALDIPLYHHERWDGAGYPQGLAGEQIPLAARIFAVADVWDALRSDRPYRAAWGETEARTYIAREAGRQFDPRVVEAFLRMLGAEG
ncbi:MAG TPA: PAS domain S-box protein [bacterium]|nr:PAS domain S-box protein [bacterium]